MRAIDGIDPELAARYKGAPGMGSRLRWLFSGIWLLYFLGPVSGLFGPGHSAWWPVCGVALWLVFSVIYVGALCYRWREGYPPYYRVVVFASLCVLAAIGSVVYGAAWTSLWIYVSAATGLLIGGWRRALIAILAVICCFSLFAWLSHLSLTMFAVLLLPTTLTGVAMVSFRRQMMLVQDLALARRSVAQLAANDERLRLARDLHDLTGHSLSLITLKTELAQRLLARLPESSEREALYRELGDVERVSRQTLHDIREAVSGYRRPTLAVEIVTARTALDAAGIELADDEAVSLRSGTFDADAEAALAWCLREATTNLIRHSGARRCRVDLREQGGELALRVIDDGRGPVTVSPASGGSGLHGMSERLSAVDGRLSTGPVNEEGGFRLVASVPYRPIGSAPAVMTPALDDERRAQPTQRANVPL